MLKKESIAQNLIAIIIVQLEKMRGNDKRNSEC